MIKKKIQTNNNFQKSIESTAKVISEKKKLKYILWRSKQ